MLKEKLLALQPNGHPDHEDALRNLAISFGARYHRTHDEEDISRAISLDETMLALRPYGHPDHPDALRSLAISLSARYNQTHDEKDISYAISLQQKLRDIPKLL